MSPNNRQLSADGLILKQQQNRRALRRPSPIASPTEAENEGGRLPWPQARLRADGDEGSQSTASSEPRSPEAMAATRSAVRAALSGSGSHLDEQIEDDADEAVRGRPRSPRSPKTAAETVFSQPVGFGIWFGCCLLAVSSLAAASNKTTAVSAAA